MMRHLFPLPALALLAACGANPPEQSPANQGVETIEVEPAPAPTANAEPPAPPPETAEPAEPATGKPLFAGHWAVDKAACASPPWKFTEKDLTTKGEVYCRFDKVNDAPGGYDIAAMCQAEGNETRETMRLRLTNAAAMTVDSDETYDRIALIRCGD